MTDDEYLEDDRRALERLCNWHEAGAQVTGTGQAGRDEALLVLRDLRLLRGLIDQAETDAVTVALEKGATWPEVAGFLGVTFDEVDRRWRDDDTPMARVWSRVVEHEGERFTAYRGGDFTYRVSGRCLLMDRANWVIRWADLEAALGLVPLRSPAPIQNLVAPAYIHGILMDDRIRGADW
jgi:hypothetical protein